MRFKIYRTRAIISRGLYIFYPIFHYGLHCRVLLQTIDILKKEIFQFLDLKSAIYDWKWLIIKSG